MTPTVAVVIPCFNTRDLVLPVLNQIGPEVHSIYVVDDKCPLNTGAFVAQSCSDSRVKVLYHTENRGVGGATITGYRQALADGADIVVKLDSDGQMPPALIQKFIDPILQYKADYTKGNRFYDLVYLNRMPKIRQFGNAVLSFFSKTSSGYWSIMDPTNGFTAIHRDALARLPLEKLANRYFFESDMLFRLNTLRAVVKDVPMQSVYDAEPSGLKPFKILPEFLLRHFVCLCKRLFYTYYLRDFNLASLHFVCALPLLLFGVLFGAYHWLLSSTFHQPATSGTVMVATLPIVMGFQLLLSAIGYDLGNEPKEIIHTVDK